MDREGPLELEGEGEKKKRKVWSRVDTYAEYSHADIARKDFCDCKSFYLSGFNCSHVIALLSLDFGLDLKSLSATLPAIRNRGRPRKPLGPLQREVVNQQKLKASIAKKPGLALGSPVLKAFNTTTSDGQSERSTFLGSVVTVQLKSSPISFTIRFDDDNDTEDVYLDELVQLIAAANDHGHFRGARVWN